MPSPRSAQALPEEVARAADLLGRRWVLAQRLSELEEAGILERRVIDARPPRVEYRLTDAGRRLRALVRALDHCAGDLCGRRAR